MRSEREKILLGDVIRFPNPDALIGAAVAVIDDHILRDINEPAGQITCIGGSKRSVCQAFAGAVRGDEIFEGIESVAEIGANGQRDNTSGGIRHQAAHTR